MSGGDKLQAALAKIVGRMKSADVVKVGFLEGATYPSGESVALVASVQEFGSSSQGIPPRPFFRTMIAKDAPGWGGEMAKVLKATDYDAAQTLGLMGERLKGQLQDSVLHVSGPALKPETVARKGFATLLIDSSVMINSIDYEVETK